jgi:hypothetical protein
MRILIDVSLWMFWSCDLKSHYLVRTSFRAEHRGECYVTIVQEIALESTSFTN